VNRDRIEIRGLRIVAAHGALAHEREIAQPFELDLDLEHDAVLAGGSDRLADTVDYGSVVTAAAAVVRDRSFLLLEALAQAVAGAVLGLDPRITVVEVSVRKLRPPIAEHLDSVGVRIRRERRAADPGRS
jgi:dihydroneopterin aldolase